MVIADLRNIYFRYEPNVWVLEDFSLSIGSGEKIWLKGKNGSGKSTLARIVGALQTPDFGKVELFGNVCFENRADSSSNEKYVDENAYRQARRQIASVIQDPADQVVTELVATDIAFGPQNLNWSVRQIDEAVMTELEKAGLSDIAERDPASLSGGEQQLVCIASAIAQDPNLLILDEPTAFLDSVNRAKFYRLVDKVADDVAVIYITHDDISDIHKNFRVICL